MRSVTRPIAWSSMTWARSDRAAEARLNAAVCSMIGHSVFAGAAACAAATAADAAAIC